ncbi:MAG: replicative DNA helicase [Gracilibacteraceae bacterium]|nr:replicative DNA helicase [Gracilibacteraceae bacterium]
MDDIKVPPHNFEAEQAVLGALMLDPQRSSLIFEFVTADDFYRDNHRNLFVAIRDVFETNEPVDLVTVAEQLRQNGHLESLGGIGVIAQIASSVPSAANVEPYARIVAEKSLLRRLIKMADLIQARGFEPGQEAMALLEEAESMILEISRKQTSEGFVSLHDLLIKTFAKIERLYSNKNSLTGVPTYFRDLDRMTSGWQASDLIIIAGRPSMGKTALVLNMAQNAAIKSDVSVALFSLEMSKEQLVQRMLCSQARVDQQRVRTGNLETADWEKLVHASAPLSSASIYVDDTVGISLPELRSKSRRLKMENNIGLIIIDYLQLMTLGNRAESRQQEVAQISRGLKGIARELAVPVIALSQLNRGVELRQEKRPVMSDLLESGSIEADADVIGFIYRDEYYNPDSDKRGLAEIIIAKHRNGPVGTVELGFLKEFTLFVNYDRVH